MNECIDEISQKINSIILFTEKNTREYYENYMNSVLYLMKSTGNKVKSIHCNAVNGTMTIVGEKSIVE